MGLGEAGWKCCQAWDVAASLDLTRWEEIRNSGWLALGTGASSDGAVSSTGVLTWSWRVQGELAAGGKRRAGVSRQ